MQGITQELTSPFRWNKKTSGIRAAIDKQINFAPRVQVIYLKPKDFQMLLKTIPDEAKSYFDGTPHYRGRLIKQMEMQ